MLRGPLLFPTTVDRFFDDPTSGVNSPRTRRNWRSLFRRLQEEHPGKRMNEFDTDDLLEFVHSRDVSNSTKLDYANALRSLFLWALDVELIDRDPAALLKRKMRSVRPDKRRTHNWLDLDEVVALIETCSGSDPIDLRDRVVLMLGFHTGLRVSEIAAVRWAPRPDNPSHASLSSRAIVVLGKGAKLAEVPMSDELFEALVEWRGHCARGLGRPVADDPVVPRIHRVGGESFDGKPPTFEIHWHKPLTNAGIGGVVKRRGRLIGRDTLAPHDMRRSLAGILDAQGVPHEEIKDVLRHSNVAVTQRYLSANPLRVRSTVKDLRFTRSAS